MKLNRIPTIISILTILASFGCQNSKEIKQKKMGPIAKKQPKELTIHGDTRIDNYYWMRERENPEVVAYLEEENAYTKKCLKHTETLQQDLFTEMKGRIKETDESVPYKSNGYYYYSRYEEGKEYGINCRKKETLESPEEVILDENVRAKTHSFYALGGMSVSPNNTLLGIGEDTVSRRIYTIRFKNLSSGEYLTDVIENTTGYIVWANDNEHVFYTQKDETLRSYKIFRHKLGTEQAEDVEVFHEEDATFSCYIGKSKSKKYLVLGSASTVSTEMHVLDANNPTGEFKVIQPRERDLEYNIAHFGDYFYVITNLEAKNFRLMKTSLDKTTKEHWEEVVPHRKDVLLEDIEIFKEYLVLTERKEGLINLRVKAWDNSVDEYLEFNDPAYVAYTTVNRDYDTEWLRYAYSSLTTPFSQYDINLKTKERKLLKQQEVVGGYNPDEYVSERLFARAEDGTKVPISLVYKKSLRNNDGTNPLLLYGYGSYGYSIDPSFSSVRLSLLDRGFVYAIAHIRGGEELGRTWYEDGKMLNKKNTFTDFISCGEFLIEQGYTSSNELFAMGGSAGGLLMGAVINIRPDLWKGVVAAVPFVDVVTTMLDESIPLTTGEYDEWGNPNEKEYYDYIKSYSPYDNIEAKAYPNLLITTGFHDSQVQYWEPAKWTAKLRELKTDTNLLLFHTNMDAGHGGASGRFEHLKETAMEYAFFLDLMNIKK